MPENNTPSKAWQRNQNPQKGCYLLAYPYGQIGGGEIFCPMLLGGTMSSRQMIRQKVDTCARSQLVSPRGMGRGSAEGELVMTRLFTMSPRQMIRQKVDTCAKSILFLLNVNW